VADGPLIPSEPLQFPLLVNWGHAPRQVGVPGTIMRSSGLISSGIPEQ
jgi:hypothetical protein